MPRITRNRITRYSILLVCEGEKTEPNFYYDLISLLNDAPIYFFSSWPGVVENGETNTGGGRSVVGRTTNYIPFNNGKRVGIPPKNYVEEGVEALEQKGFNEAWIVYDKDGHPKHKDAYKIASEWRKIHHSNALNLIYSSRCFEYYLLEHHEFCTRYFGECECKERKKVQNCCHPYKNIGPKACNGVDGKICINGYARRKGYWIESKDDNAISTITNIWYGIYNAHKLKWMSLTCLNPGLPFYVRNPYLNTYRLTLRLMEMASLEHSNEIVEIIQNLGRHIIKRYGDILEFMNETPINFILNPPYLRKYSVIPHKTASIFEDDEDLTFKPGIRIGPYNKVSIKLDTLIKEAEYLLIFIGGHRYFCALEGVPSRFLDVNSIELTSAIFTPI